MEYHHPLPHRHRFRMKLKSKRQNADWCDGQTGIKSCKKVVIFVNSFLAWLCRGVDGLILFFLSYITLILPYLPNHQISGQLMWLGDWPVSRYPGLYSLSGKTSHRQISWSFEAARLGVMIIAPLWNLTGPSAALPPRGLSNCRAIGKV